MGKQRWHSGRDIGSGKILVTSRKGVFNLHDLSWMPAVGHQFITKSPLLVPAVRVVASNVLAGSCGPFERND